MLLDLVLEDIFIYTSFSDNINEVMEITSLKENQDKNEKKIILV